jgi:hypothetical protein
MFKVGQVTHFYDSLGVAIIELDAPLAVKDKIVFVSGGKDLFAQEVESIQIGHEKMDSAKSGEMIGLKTSKIVEVGTDVYKR